MTLLTKGLLVFFIVTILQTHAFSQEPTSGLSQYRIGESLMTKDPDKAFQNLEKAMNLSRQKRDWELYMKSVNKLAALDLGGSEERQTQVFAWLKEASEIFKDAQKTDQLAQLHFNVGKFYSDLTQEVEIPIEYFESAKRIWISLKGEQNEHVANCYHGLGDVYKYNKFDFHAAEKNYEKALLIRNEIKFEDLVVLYRNYYSLAATNGSQRDFEKALSYGSRTLEIAKKLEPIRLEMSTGMMANIYRDMGESTLAKKHYLNALALNEKTTKNLETKAWYYLCLGETFKYDSLLNDADYYFRKAYQLYKSPAVSDQGLFMSLLINMSDTYSLMRDRKNFSKKSIRITLMKDDTNFRLAINEILRELQSLNMLHSAEAANVWLIVGKNHDLKKRYDSSLFYYQKALVASVASFESDNILDNPTEDMVGFQYYVNEILARKASALKSIFESSGDIQYLTQSLFCLQLAEKLLSKQRNTLDMEDSKWQFMEENYDLYENIISNLYEGKKTLPKDSVNQLAFLYFERSKARSLADALTQTERTKQITSQDSLFRLHADLKRQLFSAQENINRELEKTASSGEMSRLRDEIVSIDQKIQVLKRAIEEKYPGYFNVKYGYQTAPLIEIQKTIGSKDQVLLEYFWGNKCVYGLGVTGDEIIFKRIGSADSIKSLVNGLLLHLSDKHSSMSLDQFNSFTANAHQLYKVLIEPFKPLLSRRNRLQIIPDGSISQIPFEILLEKKPSDNAVNYRSLKYMIRSFAIGYAYSSAMLSGKKSFRRIVAPSLLAIGFTGGEQLRSENPELEEIEGAEQELIALEKRFNAGKFLVGKEATESNFKALAPQYDIIHLAIHGLGDVKKNFAASLYFRSKFDKKEDGELHAYELYGLKLKALMAVLSSCESGLGKGYKGEGMISMASAFTYSGCENILMSLWKVNDQAATLLMDDFYNHLLKGSTIDDALRQAKLDYLERADELTADPKVWAPLVAYGSLDQIFQKDRSSSFMFVGIVLFTILLLSFFLFKKKSRFF